MNIIIAGCGGVGSTLAEQLTAEGHEVTILDYDSKNLQTVTSQYDVMGIQGNSTSYRAQLEAGVDKADLLIAVTNHDEVNMLTCLIARKQVTVRRLPESGALSISQRLIISGMNLDYRWQ